MTVTVGNTVLVGCFFDGISGCNSISDSLANTWTLIVSNGAGKLWQSPITIGGSDLINIASPSGYSAIVGAQYTGVTAIGNVNQASGTVATPVTLQSSLSTVSNDATFEVFGFFDQGGAGCDTATAQNGQTKLVDACVNTPQPFGEYISGWNLVTVGTNNYGINVSGLGGANIQYTHLLAELQGSTLVTSGVVTQCFGNCGTPPVKLVNTNSTKTVNFNQSLTLLYQFQSPLNGFVNNVTVSLATATPATQILSLALYIQTCPSGTQPMTSACPAVQQLGNSYQGAIGKGPKAMPAGQGYAVGAGQWVVIGVSAAFSGLQLNDTNTAVPIFSTSGTTPSVITAANSFDSGAKIGLWAWITGGVVTGPLPSTGPCGNNFAQLDCLLPAMSNSLCAVLTASCQTSASLFWIIILTFLSFLLITVGFASAHVTKFVGAGEVFMFFFLAWFFMFAGVGLLETFVVVFFLFVGAISFARVGRQYF